MSLDRGTGLQAKGTGLWGRGQAQEPQWVLCREGQLGGSSTSRC